jgi:hypothetical protein
MDGNWCFRIRGGDGRQIYRRGGGAEEAAGNRDVGGAGSGCATASGQAAGGFGGNGLRICWAIGSAGDIAAVDPVDFVLWDWLQVFFLDFLFDTEMISKYIFPFEATENRISLLVCSYIE